MGESVTERKKKDTDDERYEVKDKLTVKLAELFKSLGKNDGEGKSPNELFRIKNKLKF